MVPALRLSSFSATKEALSESSILEHAAVSYVMEYITLSWIFFASLTTGAGMQVGVANSTCFTH